MFVSVFVRQALKKQGQFMENISDDKMLNSLFELWI